MKSIVTISAIFVLLYASAATARDAALEAPIQKFIASSNKGDVEGAKTAWVPSPTIIDELAPFRWSGPKALETWAADLSRWAAAEGHTGGKVTMTAPSREVVSGGHAYVIVPTTYTFQQKGKTLHEVAQITYVLAKSAAGWKIESSVWTGPEATPVDH